MSIKGFSVGGNVERYDYNFLDNRPSEITVDTALSDSSTNPVQNSAVTNAINAANGSISSVSGDVDDLKSAFIDGVIKVTALNNPDSWQFGGINGSTGLNENNSIQCRIAIANAFYAEDDSIIKNKSTDFYMFIYQYADAACTDCKGELSTYFGTTLTEIALPKGYYYRFKAQMNPYVTMTAAVIAELVTKFSVSVPTQIQLNKEDIEGLESKTEANTVDIAAAESRFYTEYGINRNPNNDIPGYLKADGSIGASPAYWTTDFCYVGDLTEVICTVNAVGGTLRYAQDMAFLCTYDSDKNFIEQVYTTGSSTYTPTTGVAYIRFCINKNVTENAMLTAGTTVYPAFIEYVAPRLMLKPEYYNSGANWSDKKWVALGDSLTEYNSKADKYYHDYIREATGIETVNMGSSGTGYKRTEDEDKAFYQRILTAPTDADVVTIFGSGNDLNYSAMGFNTFAEALGNPTDSTTATICGCINKTIDNLYSIMPTVQFGIITPCPWETMNPANVGNDMDLYSQAIIEICKRRGIPCLDLYHCSGLRPWEASYRQLCYSNDGGAGVHPNDLGHKILAPHFKAFLDTLLI